MALLCAQILGKAEFLNPGGSIKDRVALAIVREAAAEGRLRRGGLITEGSAGALQSSLSACLVSWDETVSSDHKRCVVHAVPAPQALARFLLMSSNLCSPYSFAFGCVDANKHLLLDSRMLQVSMPPSHRINLQKTLPTALAQSVSQLWGWRRRMQHRHQPGHRRNCAGLPLRPPASELWGGVGAGSTGISLAMVAAAQGCRCAHLRLSFGEVSAQAARASAWP